MNRRGWILGGAALAAGAAGAGIAWWRGGPSAADERAAQIWTMQFETINGGPPLALGPLRGKPTLLNFWATWCAPCISELPLIDRFQREQQGTWQVIGLAVDRAEPVTAFLAKRPVGFAIGLAGLEGVELSQRMGNNAGALPFSVVFDRHGNVIQRKLGTIQADDLQRWVAAAAG